MPDTELSAPVLITDPKKLLLLVELLEAEPIVAVDTESNSLYAYRERVCLIQFSTPDNDYLVDPLALEDLSPLAPLFANPDIEKVFHAAEYDILCLRRDFGFQFVNLFDTMIAARILGWEKVGLGSILKSQFGAKLNKRLQRADWGRRPLPAEYLTYARFDTHYLIRLRNRLFAELQEKDLWDLAQEDFRLVSKVEFRKPTANANSCWRINGSHDLDPRQVAVLHQLYVLRDRLAMQMDRPVFKVFGDQTMVAVARECPQTMGQLWNLRGIHAKQVRRYGEKILEAVKKGLKSRPPEHPARSRPDFAFISRVEALRRWRKNTAQKMGVESDVILPRSVLYEIAKKDPLSKDALERIMQQVPWRLDRYGGAILKVLSNGKEA